MAESIRLHETPFDVIIISGEDTDFDEQQVGYGIQDEEVVLGSLQRAEYPIGFYFARPNRVHQFGGAVPLRDVFEGPEAKAGFSLLRCCCECLLHVFCTPLYIASSIGKCLKRVILHEENTQSPADRTVVPANPANRLDTEFRNDQVHQPVESPRRDFAHQPCEDKLGGARLGYALKLVRHGVYGGRPSSLIVLDFDFNYNDTCAITRADITIILGSTLTEQSVKPDDTPIVPFATDMRWPRQASGPSSETGINDEMLWKLKLGAQGYTIETPERKQTTLGKRTDSSWRITGGPVFVDKPFRCRRGFLWRVDGHEFNRFPVPESFSLGMIVTHDLVDFWVLVKIEGSLRGILRSSAATLGWRSRKPQRWMIQPEESPTILETDLVTEMQGRYKSIFHKLQFENDANL